MPASTRAGRRRHPVGVYLVLLVAGAVALAVALPIGARIKAAPQAPPLGRVGSGAAACLGDLVATSQSGVFLDLHEPGDGGELGPRLARGRVDRANGSASLTGRCLSDGALGDVPLSASIRVAADEASIVGQVTVERRVLTLSIVETGAEVGGEDGREPLEGGELVGRIFLAVAVVILAARTVGLLFSRIRQPRVVGEIVAGIVLGPSLVGAFVPEVTTYLFPPEVTGVLRVMAQFGLIFFMFLIGLELDLRLVRRSGRDAVLISHASIVVPFILGTLAALVLYPLLGSGDFAGFALFMGAAMAITAFPVLARILTETGIYRTRLGALSITCAAVDDVTAWCILAVVVAIVKSTGALDAVQTIALSLTFVLGMIFLVRPLLARLSSVYDTRGKLNPPVMAGLLVGLFLAAWATEEIGIHAIFGAFMVGVTMPRSKGLVAEITEKLEDVTVLFLLPIFFAVVGLSTRVNVLDRPLLWAVAGFITVVAIVGKWGGSMIASRATGTGWRHANALGLLMNARGLTEIVILTVGRSLGVISPALFTMMVLMALVTTFMATPLLAVFYPRRLIEREAAHFTAVAERAELGTRHPAGYRVMIGVGEAAHGELLAAVVRSMRGPDGRRPEVVLATVAPFPGREEVRANLTSLDRAAEEARASLGPLAGELVASGLDTRVRASVGESPGEELTRMASLEGADLLLVGWHHAYVGRNQLGGVVQDVFAESGCDVAVLVDGQAGAAAGLGSGPICVWYGGGLHDGPALVVAANLCRGRDMPLLVLGVDGSPAPPEVGVPVERVVVGSRESTALLEAAAGVEAALVVLGQSDGADGTTFGAQRDRIIADASVPVLVVKRGSTTSGHALPNGQHVAMEHGKQQTQDVGT